MNLQVLIQVLCKKDTESLRQAINDKLSQDPRNSKRISVYGIKVTEESRKGRSPGWSKRHSCTESESDTHRKVNGAINVEWDADTRMLICRSVSNDIPSELITRLLRYLLTTHGKRIESISVFPR